MPVRVSYEFARGCGMRKVGGLYLVSPPTGINCGRFPIHTTVCPCCGAGIKPARGYTWVDGDAIKDMARICTHQIDRLNWASLTNEKPGVAQRCGNCPLRHDDEAPPIGRAGLIWIGTQHYPTPQDFQREGMVLGFSRRLPGNRLPRGFKIGETWVYLGHKYAVAPWEIPGALDERDQEIRAKNIRMSPGIFGMWRPTAAEKIVPEEYDPEEVERLERRGINAVIVKPAQAEIEGIDDGEEEVPDTEG